MRRLKIGIRPQLIILVCFSSLFSLLILGVVTALYYASNLGELRAERLQVISQLKGTQVAQALQYTYYQVYYLTTMDVISLPLSAYKAGNVSLTVFLDAQSTLDKFISSSELFASARLYNLDLAVVAESYNNVTAISTSTMDALYPLSENATIPPDLQDLDASGYYTGPLINSSSLYYGIFSNSLYFMGLTLPVYANSSIVFPEPTLAGYLTVLVSAANVQVAINGTNTTSNGTSLTNLEDYNIIAIRPVYGDKVTGVDNVLSLSHSTLLPNGQQSVIIGFEAVLPLDVSLVPNIFYSINSSTAAKAAFSQTTGSSQNTQNKLGQQVAIGYTTIQIDPLKNWTIIIAQSRGTFLGPVKKLTNIIVGVVIGTGVFMCCITFPLAVYYIKPITILKDATESITQSKKKKDVLPQYPLISGNTWSNYFQSHSHTDSEKHSRNTSSTYGNLSNGNTASITTSFLAHRETTGLTKRNSVTSASTGNSSGYASGIRLPGKIPNSKKFFKDELTELTDAFNIMTDELDKQYTHLEDRVKERTKQLEASKIEAEAANEAKTVFIANISHELRTPLNGILGMTSIAMDEEDPDKIGDSLKLIHRSGELLLHILTELLTYSKNTLNRSKLEKSNFQILEVVYQVKSIFDKLAMDQRVNFKILLKPNILRKLILYGDSNRIIQIVMNLVSNSLKFTPVDGSVDVLFKLLGEYDMERSQNDNFTKVHVLKAGATKLNSENLSKFGAQFLNGESTVKSSSLNKPYFSGKKKYYATKAQPATPEEKESLFPPQRKPSITAQRKQSISTSSATHGKTDENNSTGSSFNEKNVSGDENDVVEVDFNDNVSVTTLSTAEYENKIFESQFHHLKALPRLPRDDLPELPSGRTSSERPEDRRSISSNSLGRGRNPSSRSLPIPPDKPITSVPHPSMIRAQSTYRAPEKLQYATNMAQNELVKNNKAYRIRSMYKPKTWALQVEVTDTGPGIKPGLQEKVFEPFIQGDQTLSRSYGGTGLGLSICRQLATMMKGTLTLKSTVGEGSTFTFTVPLPQTGEIQVGDDEMAEFCEDEFNASSRMNRKVGFVMEDEEIGRVSSEAGTPETEKSKESSMSLGLDVIVPRIVLGSGKDESLSSSGSPRKPKFKLDMPPKAILFEKPHLIARSSTGTANSSNGGHESPPGMDPDLKILVAEDNMVNQEVIKRMLRLEGFTNLSLACNGEEAVDFINEGIELGENYDLVFMDVQMPKIDGLTATRMIRNLGFEKPIIALTAFADESNMKECLNSGMTGFLAKPIRRTNLRRVILEYSPIVLGEMVSTPQTMSGDEKRLGYGAEKPTPEKKQKTP